MTRFSTALALVLALAAGPACSEPAPAPAKPELLTFQALLERPRQAPDARIAYGSGPQQFADLWLPKGAGPFPVVVLIHGGCWLAELPGVELMDQMAADLKGRGYAVWNVEYRRIGHDGGGYPGTMQDVGRGVDALRGIAAERRLDLDRVVVAGHSAGGHLASWVASRGRIPKGGPLWAESPLPVKGAVSLAGITDLQSYRETGPTCGGAKTIDALTGAAGRAGQDVYADTSPAAMAPTGVEQVVVSGALDPITPPRFGKAYVERLRAAGDPAENLTLEGAGHFELIDPISAAWTEIVARIERLVR